MREQLEQKLTGMLTEFSLPKSDLNKSDYLVVFKQVEGQVVATVPKMPVLGYCSFDCIRCDPLSVRQNDTLDVIIAKMEQLRDRNTLKQLYEETNDGTLTQIVPTNVKSQSL